MKTPANSAQRARVRKTDYRTRVERTGGTDRLDAVRLGQFEMLRGVGLSARQALLREGNVTTLAPGEVLVTPGQATQGMYLVIEGLLEVRLDSVESETVAAISSGETVGELSALDGSPTSAYVVATRPSSLLAVDEASFWRLINDSHGFAVNLLVKLAQRLRANNAAVSENARKRRRFERAAMFDGLTGIHNRRWLDEMLGRMVKRNAQLAKDVTQDDFSPGELCVAVADIDHFKQFNDTYGHAAGDHVLTEVAATLARHVRPTDHVARFGGEEFVIIFPDTDLVHAVGAAERIRKAVASCSLYTPDGIQLSKVTISLGVARLEPDQTVAELLSLADRAMYRAKRNGRNRVEYA
ncbi:MAG: GGDEF domain-containing protein [Proteobacteria bacterium]|nr:GGDEF domain-containing protein [Pseudomonadota bacterium]